MAQGSEITECVGSSLERAWTRALAWGGLLTAGGLVLVWLIDGHGWAVGLYVLAALVLTAAAASQLVRGCPDPVPLVIGISGAFLILQPFLPTEVVMVITALVLMSTWAGVLVIDSRRALYSYVGYMEFVILSHWTAGLLGLWPSAYSTGQGFDLSFPPAVQGGVLLGGVLMFSLIRRELQGAKELVAEKDALLSGFAQALRTPLTSVVGFASLLRDEDSPPSAEEISDFARLIWEAGTEASHTIDDLLVQTRDDIGTLNSTAERIDVGEQIQRALADLSERQKARVVIEEGTATVETDARHFRHLVRNLVASALHLSDDTVRVAVTISNGFIHTAVHYDSDHPTANQTEGIFQPYRQFEVTPGQPIELGIQLAVADRLATFIGGNLTWRARPKPAFEIALPTPPSGLLLTHPPVGTPAGNPGQPGRMLHKKTTTPHTHPLSLSAALSDTN